MKILKRKNKELVYEIYDMKDCFNPFHKIIGTTTIFGTSPRDIMNAYRKDVEFHKKNGHACAIIKRSWM